MDDHLNVLLKTSEVCNLNCIYCYETDKSTIIMSDITLKTIISNLEERADDISTDYTWHGAEPLTAGIAFFKKVIEYQKPYKSNGNHIKNSIQSNGTLLTDELADFFVENNFGVGFSLDGTSELHHSQRPYNNGNNSYQDVIRGINLMRERGEKIWVITVLSKINLPYIEEIYDLYNQMNINFKLNPILNCGDAKNVFSDIGLEKGDYSRAIIKLFDKSLESKSINFDQAQSYISNLFLRDNSVCSGSDACQNNFIAFDVNGYAIPCTRFTKNQISYGNIHNDELSIILNNPIRLQLSERKNKIEECQPCEIKELCYSGCMHNALLSGNILNKDPLCNDQKIIYEHVAGRIIQNLK